MPQERREFERMRFSAPIRYQKKGSQEFGNSVGKDISCCGIGFVSNEFFPVSTHLIFEVQHPQTRAYIKAVGEIIWVSNKAYSEKYDIGAKFLGPPITV